MKYKLLKDLPLAKAGTEVFIYSSITSGLVDIRINEGDGYISCLKKEDIPEWLEEVKEPKTIYDIKKGDKYYEVYANLQINSNIYNGHSQVKSNMFLTEREAKRNKLLRELATRTDKWLPEKGDNYYSYHLNGCDSWNWQGDNTDMVKYHMGLVFRNEEEYDKWMTPEAKDLLFNI